MDKISVEVWLDTEPKRRVVIENIGGIEEVERLSEQVSTPMLSVRLTASRPGAKMIGSVSVYTEPTKVVIVASTVQEVVTAYRRLVGEPPEQVYAPTSKTVPVADHHHHPARRSPAAPDYYGLWDGDGVILVPPHRLPDGDGIDFLAASILPS